MSFFFSDEDVFKKETLVFCRYLVGEDATETVIKLYSSANNKLDLQLTSREKMQLIYLLESPWMLPFIDAALAIVHPQGAIRKKLYLMFCITESIPEYSRHFLPRAQSKTYIFSALARICLSGIRIPVGLILLLWI
jgi:hypothetical protein